MEAEGVIKFAREHRHEPLRAEELGPNFAAMRAWRSILRALDLIGESADRYGGAGFGNLSIRGAGTSLFLISGSQTGGLADAGPEAYVAIDESSTEDNRVRSRGLCLPSSESMTHAVFYKVSAAIGAVFHVHSPLLWTNNPLSLPTTPKGVAYGTQAMAEAVASLYATPELRARRLLCMTGHEDGILAFGRTPAEAGGVLVEAYAAALAGTDRAS